MFLFGTQRKNIPIPHFLYNPTMAKEIEFSVMMPADAQAQFLQKVVADFRLKHRTNISLVPLNWAEGREKLLQIALYRHGADLSDVGSTWVSDFIGMNGLRPFSPREQALLGGEGAFIPSVWKVGRPLNVEGLWAIPWGVSPTVIVYRKDKLAQAGVDEKTAFSSFGQMENTLQRLKEKGSYFQLPLEAGSYTSLHMAASWLWGHGGDLVSPDGKRAIFDSAEAQKAVVAYFNLRRFFAPDWRQAPEAPYPQDFRQGKTAICLGGSWAAAPRADVLPEVSANLRVAPLPGSAFVGSQHFVVWNHTRQPEAAIELVRYLTSKEALSELVRTVYLLPARLDLLEGELYQKNEIYKALASAAVSGRTFPTMSLFGLLEQKLSGMLEQIWRQLRQDPDQDVESLVREIVTGLVRRLNATLGS